MKKPKKQRQMRIYQQDVAAAAKVSLNTVKRAVKNNELNMDSLYSISCFIISKTLKG